MLILGYWLVNISTINWCRVNPLQHKSIVLLISKLEYGTDSMAELGILANPVFDGLVTSSPLLVKCIPLPSAWMVVCGCGLVTSYWLTNWRMRLLSRRWYCRSFWNTSNVLVADRLISIEIEYTKSDADEMIQLSWQSISQPLAIIDSHRLFRDTGHISGSPYEVLPQSTKPTSPQDCSLSRY